MDAKTLAEINWIPTVVSLAALSVIWADIRSFKKKIMTNIKSLEGEVKKSLYQDSGISRYIPRSECERQTNGCQTMICGKIEEIKVMMRIRDEEIKKRIDAMDAKREATKDDLNRSIKQLHGAIENVAGKLSGGNH